jgi:branched-chain amino acid aminotransferase
MSQANADSKFIWMDGKLIPSEQATVHSLSHSLHYGGAVFEGIRAYETTQGKAAIFRAQEHFQRFQDSMHALGYVSHYSPLDLIKATCDVVKANELTECYIRPFAYIDDGTRGLKLPNPAKAKVAIAAWKWGKYMGDEGQTKGIRVGVSSFRRPDISSSMTWAKCSGNYLISVQARREASNHGLDEAILLDPQGFVAEGSGENLFLVKNGKLLTPSTGFILPGITRDSVMTIARDLGLSVSEEHITRNQLYLADEVFFSGTAVEVTPIREVDGRNIGEGRPGPITKKISDIFFKTVRHEIPKYAEWLTLI